MSISTARRLPAEWEPHLGTIVAWPGRAEVWGEHLDAGRHETLELVRAIARSEHVLLAVDPESKQSASPARGTNVTTVPIPLDDCWARDISPLFAIGASGLVAVDFEFNAWGGKFVPHRKDAMFGLGVSDALGIQREDVALVLEGGSITTDGQGTAVLVEDTVLGSNRNPGVTREAVEAILQSSLGLETFIWLPYGLLGDTDTDGHVDNVAVFVRPGSLLVQVAPSGRHEDAARLAVNRMVLQKARDAQGRQLSIIEVPWLPTSPFDNSRPCSYVNSYLTNDEVLVPTVGAPSDEQALAILGEAFGRTPRALPSAALSFGGGGPHCMAMNIPALAS